MKNMFAAVVAILLSVTAAKATTEEVMRDMISYIVDNSDLEYNGEKLPFLEIRTISELCQKYAPGMYEEQPENCNIAGIYDDQVDVIYISDEPAPYMSHPDFFETVLFHELVHYLQDINGVYETVECLQNLEKLAYELQTDYINDMGLNEDNKPDPLFSMFVSMCPSEFPHHMMNNPH